MQHANWTPILPDDLSTPKSRRITGPSVIWNLPAVQEALRVGTLGLTPTVKAAREMLMELNWSNDDLKGYLLALYPARQVNQQWCKTPNGQKFFASDAYCMGYDRHRATENSFLSPWAYVKFTVLATNVVVFSAHPKRFNS